ncbi:MAG TPA: YkgJ family cysteine cluster protein [Thermoanaerobaculia bacterium]|nr:YkgJ family cysteine cluster protein [Thermoanaerobaculia bacterium]
MASPKQIERLKQAFGVASAAWHESAARTIPGELACRAGCFGCCVGLFDISLPEAALVREGVARLSAEERENGVRRARQIVEETAAVFPGDARAGLLDSERSEGADDEYFAVVAGRACPMLELPSGRCRIYEERPITCRTYGFAWSRDGAVFHPPCGLNLPGALEERQLATSVDIGLLDQAEDVDGELAADLGIEPAGETTIPHAVLGTAFGPPPG